MSNPWQVEGYNPSSQNAPIKLFDPTQFAGDVQQPFMSPAGVQENGSAQPQVANQPPTSQPAAWNNQYGGAAVDNASGDWPADPQSGVEHAPVNNNSVQSGYEWNQPAGWDPQSQQQQWAQNNYQESNWQNIDGAQNPSVQNPGQMAGDNTQYNYNREPQAGGQPEPVQNQMSYGGVAGFYNNDGDVTSQQYLSFPSQTEPTAGESGAMEEITLSDNQPSVPLMVQPLAAHPEQNPHTDNVPVFAHSDSFTNLSLDPSPFDNLGNGASFDQISQDSALLSTNTSGNHSRQSSSGNNDVKFIVGGSAVSTPLNSKSGSPMQFVPVGNSPASQHAASLVAAGGQPDNLTQEHIGNSQMAMLHQQQIQSVDARYADGINVEPQHGGPAEPSAAYNPAVPTMTYNQGVPAEPPAYNYTGYRLNADRQVITPLNRPSSAASGVSQHSSLEGAFSGLPDSPEASQNSPAKYMPAAGSGAVHYSDDPTTPRGDVQPPPMMEMTRDPDTAPPTQMESPNRTPTAINPYGRDSANHPAQTFQTSPALYNPGMPPVSQIISGDQAAQTEHQQVTTPDAAQPAAPAQSLPVQQHQMDIYATPIEPHPDSAFQPLQKPPSITDTTASSQSPNQTYTSTGMPEGQNNELSVAHIKSDVDSLQPLNEDYKHSLSYQMHKNRHDNNMSPATTLWHNPEPEGQNVKLAPAAPTSTDTRPIMSPPVQALSSPSVPLDVKYIQDHIRQELQSAPITPAMSAPVTPATSRPVPLTPEQYYDQQHSPASPPQQPTTPSQFAGEPGTPQFAGLSGSPQFAGQPGSPQKPASQLFSPQQDLNPGSPGLQSQPPYTQDMSAPGSSPLSHHPQPQSCPQSLNMSAADGSPLSPQSQSQPEFNQQEQQIFRQQSSQEHNLPPGNVGAEQQPHHSIPQQQSDQQQPAPMPQEISPQQPAMQQQSVPQYNHQQQSQLHQQQQGSPQQGQQQNPQHQNLQNQQLSPQLQPASPTKLQQPSSQLQNQQQQEPELQHQPGSPQHQQPMSPQRQQTTSQKQLMSPQQQPMSPQQQPMSPQQQKMSPQQQPMSPQQQPMSPQQQPLSPQQQPMSPQQQPVSSQQQPMSPQQQPISQHQQPMSPQQQPMSPMQQPMASQQQQPTSPQQQPMSPHQLKQPTSPQQQQQQPTPTQQLSPQRQAAPDLPHHSQQQLPALQQNTLPQQQQPLEQANQQRPVQQQPGQSWQLQQQQPAPVQQQQTAPVQQQTTLQEQTVPDWSHQKPGYQPTNTAPQNAQSSDHGQPPPQPQHNHNQQHVPQAGLPQTVPQQAHPAPGQTQSQPNTEPPQNQQGIRPQGQTNQGQGEVVRAQHNSFDQSVAVSGQQPPVSSADPHYNRHDESHNSSGRGHEGQQGYSGSEHDTRYSSSRDPRGYKDKSSHYDYRGDPRYDPHYSDQQRQDPYYRDQYRQSSQGYYEGRYDRYGYPVDERYERPRSRQGYEYNDPQRPRSRQEYQAPDDRQPARPHSRQGELPSSRPSSRQGDPAVDERARRPSSRSGHEYYNAYDNRDDYYSRDKYRDYYRNSSYDDYYRDQQHGYYDRDYYNKYYKQDKYSHGYYEEMQSYNQQAGGQNSQDYAYQQHSYDYDDRRSQHSSRSHTPAIDHPDSAADQFAREFHQGSRSSSRHSGYEQSPIYDPNTGGQHPYYQQSIDQSYGYTVEQPPVVQDAVEQRRTPVKHGVAHLRVSFGPAGELVRVLSNDPSMGQPATVHIEPSFGNLLRESEEQVVIEKLEAFPGPLIKGETHKNDVMLFCKKRAQQCLEDVNLPDRESAQLIWRLLQLFIKQNGTVIGTDIADLLLEDHEPSTALYVKTGLSIQSQEASEDPQTSDTEPQVTTVANYTMINTSLNDNTDRFRSLLLRGQKKDALDCAMKNNLWGHALFLASKMDPKTHASIMTRFANVAMKMNDPLQTLYQLMSGRQPAAVTLVMNERWGDWKPHLAMILSNPSSKVELDRKSIISLGDTLASKACLFSAHFCYLVAQTSFGLYHKKASKLVLIGASHSLPFEEFASIEATQCTEIYEYAHSLGTSSFYLPGLQLYKYLYAVKLADAGFEEEALHYCEVTAKALQRCPGAYNAQLVQNVYELGSRLKFSDPQWLHTAEDEQTQQEWLTQLAALVRGIQDGSIQPVSGCQTPFGSTTTSSEVGEIMAQGQATDPGQAAQLYYQQQPQQNGEAVAQSGFTAYQQPWTAPVQQTQQQGNESQTWQQPQPVDQSWQAQPAEQQAWNQSQPAEQQAWNQSQPAEQQAWNQSQYNTDGSYLGYTQQQPQQTADPASEQSQPLDAYGQPVTSQPGGGDMDLAASMNSNFTSRSADTEDTLSGGQPDDLASSHSSVAKQPNFEHYGISTKSMHTNKELSEKGVPASMDSPRSGGMSSSFLPPGSPSSHGSSTPKASQSPNTPSNQAGVFQFGIPPPNADKYMASSKSAALGAQPSVMGGASKKQSWPGEDDTDGKKDKAAKPAAKKTDKKNDNKPGILGSLWRRFSTQKNEMILPDDKNPKIVWDEAKGCWSNTDGDNEDAQKPAAPPPTDHQLNTTRPDAPSIPTIPEATPTGTTGSAPPSSLTPSSSGSNLYSLRRSRGARGQYVDVFADQSSTKPTPVAPSNLFTVLPKSASVPTKLFVPSSVEEFQTTAKNSRVSRVSESEEPVEQSMNNSSLPSTAEEKPTSNHQQQTHAPQQLPPQQQPPPSQPTQHFPSQPAQHLPPHQQHPQTQHPPSQQPQSQHNPVQQTPQQPPPHQPNNYTQQYTPAAPQQQYDDGSYSNNAANTFPQNQTPYGGHLRQPDNLSRSSSQNSLSQEVQYIMQQQPGSQEPPPGQDMPPPQPGSMAFFDPSKVNPNQANMASGPGRGPRFGQRRVYPK